MQPRDIPEALCPEPCTQPRARHSRATRGRDPALRLAKHLHAIYTLQCGHRLHTGARRASRDVNVVVGSHKVVDTRARYVAGRRQVVGQQERCRYIERNCSVQTCWKPGVIATSAEPKWVAPARPVLCVIPVSRSTSITQPMITSQNQNADVSCA
jgi:hypothetical protein